MKLDLVDDQDVVVIHCVGIEVPHTVVVDWLVVQDVVVDTEVFLR